MKQYKITTDNLLKDSDEDCYLSPNDPIQELKIVQYLAGLGSKARLDEYQNKLKAVNKESNISNTAMEKVELMKKNKIEPGTSEWFQLWFSKPYLTGEKPIKD